jgi:hypothetical protein
MWHPRNARPGLDPRQSQLVIEVLSLARKAIAVRCEYTNSSCEIIVDTGGWHPPHHPWLASMPQQEGFVARGVRRGDSNTKVGWCSKASTHQQVQPHATTGRPCPNEAATRVSHQQQWANNHGPPVPQKQVWNQHNNNNTRHQRPDTGAQQGTWSKPNSRPAQLPALQQPCHHMPSAEGRDKATKAADAPQFAPTWLEASGC